MKRYPIRATLLTTLVFISFSGHSQTLQQQAQMRQSQATQQAQAVARDAELRKAQQSEIARAQQVDRAKAQQRERSLAKASTLQTCDVDIDYIQSFISGNEISPQWRITQDAKRTSAKVSFIYKVWYETSSGEYLAQGKFSRMVGHNSKQGGSVTTQPSPTRVISVEIYDEDCEYEPMPRDR